MNKDDLPQAEPTNQNVGNYHEEQDLELPDIPEVRTISDIIASEESFWEKAKATAVDTALGRNTVGKVVGVGLDIAGLVIPKVESTRQNIKHRLNLQTDNQMKNLLSRTFSTGGGSLIRVKDEDGNIDVTAIIATVIRLALLAGALYLANELGIYEQFKTIINGS